MSGAAPAGAPDYPRKEVSRTSPHIFIKWQIMCFNMVPETGLEPARLTAGDFKSPSSTTSDTRANFSVALKSVANFLAYQYYILTFISCQLNLIYRCHSLNLVD